MNPQRISQVCEKLKIELTDDQLVQLTKMSNSKGEIQIRSMASKKEEPKRDVLCVPGSLWSDEEMSRITNDRGMTLRCLRHLRSECLMLERALGLAIRGVVVMEDILAEMSKSEDKEIVQKKVKSAQDKHHPEQNHFPFPRHL